MIKNVAVIGCGNISDIYLTNLTNTFDNVCVYTVCDLDESKANEKADKYNTKVMTLDEILQDDKIDIVLNITTPFHHYEVCKKALEQKRAYMLKSRYRLLTRKVQSLLNLPKKTKFCWDMLPIPSWEQEYILRER